MKFDFAAERRRAAVRISLIGILVASWSAAKLLLPASSGTPALLAALSKKSPGVKASVAASEGGDGVPLASQELVLRAREIARKVNGRARDLGVDPDERTPNDDSPEVIVPIMIEPLRSPSGDDRVYAAMTLCDNRLASWERAGEAIPGLEALVAGPDPVGAEFAALALSRIRFWTERRRGNPAPGR